MPGPKRKSVNAKYRSSFPANRNPRQISWTVFYRRKHKTRTVERNFKEKYPSCSRIPKGRLWSISLDIMGKRNEKPEVRKTRQERVIGASKEAEV